MPYYNRDPKRDHNFDNQPYALSRLIWLGCGSFGWYSFGGTPHPVIVTKRDNKDLYQGPIIFLLYHYYRVGGPPKV